MNMKNMKKKKSLSRKKSLKKKHPKIFKTKVFPATKIKKMIKISLNSKPNRINLGRKAGLKASNTIPNNKSIGKISKI